LSELQLQGWQLEGHMTRGPLALMAKLSLLTVAASVVCLAQLPPSDAGNYAAKVVTQTGQVSVIKDVQPWALSVGDTVNVRDLIITGVDGHAILQVSDGSTFEVFPNSRVVFRKNPPNWRDFIDVLVGRVRVHIEHFGSVPNPNRVLTPTAVISVRGTTFDISVDDDDETTLVEVEEGTVDVQHALLPRGNGKTLNSGESLRVYRNEPLEAHVMDKGSLARQVMRSMVDAVITVATRMPRSGGVGGIGGSSGTGGAVGDTTKTPPPPPPPPAPPPLP
jgi:ferric-dicitrate binding protein FerR (iron transport regulator)